MKNFFLILIIASLISCENNSKISPEERKDLICNHFIPNIQADSFLIHHRKLAPLNLTATYQDSIYLIPAIGIIFPQTDSSSWKTKDIECINIISRSDLDIFINNIDSDTSKFQVKVISEPIFNPNNKIAAIAYSKVHSKMSLGCIPNYEFEILRFKKTKKGWKKID